METPHPSLSRVNELLPTSHQRALSWIQTPRSCPPLPSLSPCCPKTTGPTNQSVQAISDASKANQPLTDSTLPLFWAQGSLARPPWHPAVGAGGLSCSRQQSQCCTLPPADPMARHIAREVSSSTQHQLPLLGGFCSTLSGKDYGFISHAHPGGAQGTSTYQDSCSLLHLWRLSCHQSSSPEGY